MLKKTIITLVCTGIFLYLLGAFVAVDFNISNWSYDERVIIASTMGIAYVIILLFAPIFFDNITKEHED